MAKGTKAVFVETSDCLPSHPTINEGRKSHRQLFHPDSGAHRCGILMVDTRWLAASISTPSETLVVSIETGRGNTQWLLPLSLNPHTGECVHIAVMSHWPRLGYTWSLFWGCGKQVNKQHEHRSFYCCSLLDDKRTLQCILTHTHTRTHVCDARTHTHSFIHCYSDALQREPSPNTRTIQLVLACTGVMAS